MVNIQGDGWCIFRCIAAAVLFNGEHDVDLTQSDIAEKFLDMLVKFASFVVMDPVAFKIMSNSHDKQRHLQIIIELPDIFKVFIKLEYIIYIF